MNIHRWFKFALVWLVLGGLIVLAGLAFLNDLDQKIVLHLWLLGWICWAAAFIWNMFWSRLPSPLSPLDQTPLEDYQMVKDFKKYYNSFDQPSQTQIKESDLKRS